MSRYLFAVILVVPLLLATSRTARADHCCGGGEAEKKDAGEKSPEKAVAAVEPKTASVHGGVMTASGDYRIETVMHGREVRLYVFDSRGKPLSTKKVAAKAWVVSAKGKKVAVKMKHVAPAPGRSQAYLAGKTDLDYGRNAGQKLSLKISGLGGDRKGTASFDVSVKASNTVTYQCPMHGAAKSEDPGRCPDCGMSLARRETEAVAAKPKTADLGYACPMHPKITAKKPGDCRKCGMKLKASAAGGESAAAGTKYTYPMHADVTASSSGKCPKCGMNLKKLAAEEKKTTAGRSRPGRTPRSPGTARAAAAPEGSVRAFGRGALRFCWLAVLPVTLLLPAACGGGHGGHPNRGFGSVRVLPPESPVHHDVGLDLELRGRPGDSVDVRLEASTDGGASYLPIEVTPPGPFVLTGGSRTVTVTWDSFAALGTGRHDAVIRAAARPGSRHAITIANYGFVNAQDLAEWASRGASEEELLLADAWSFENWAGGHLEGAVSVPVDRILEFGATALPPSLDRTLVFYCGGGT
jgi:hypothetical protein